MREMVRKYSHGCQSSVEVCRHIILKNFWEVYVTEDFDSNGLGFGLVVGDETELGSISIDEYRPYIMSDVTGNDLNGIMPAPGWEWV